MKLVKEHAKAEFESNTKLWDRDKIHRHTEFYINDLCSDFRRSHLKRAEQQDRDDKRF